MFDISFTELLIIGVVALVVIGPEKLPKVARTAGHLLGRAQRYVSDVKSDIQREIDADEFKNLKGQVEDAARTVKASVEDASKTFSNPLDEARDALKEAADTVNSTARQTEAQIKGLSSSAQGTAGDSAKAPASATGGVASSSSGADSSFTDADSSSPSVRSSSTEVPHPAPATTLSPAMQPGDSGASALTRPGTSAAFTAESSTSSRVEPPVPEWNDTVAEPEIPHELLWDASEAAPPSVPRAGSVPSQPEKPAARNPETKQASTPPVGPRPSSETST